MKTSIDLLITQYESRVSGVRRMKNGRSVGKINTKREENNGNKGGKIDR
jgi:hypothetical protein